MIHTGKSATAKATVKEAGLGWLQPCRDVAYLLDQELSCLKKYPFYFPRCSYSTADAVTETATSWFQVLDMQREISHIHMHMYELYGWAQKHKNKTVCFICITI